jgi:hypothetical protein
MPTQPNLLPVYRHADRLLIIALWAMAGFSLALTGMWDYPERPTMTTSWHSH